MTKVCVAMIVRDEAKVIERCLASVQAHVDRWIICDTGSTDDTASRVQIALDGVPGRLFHEPWMDFSTNRNLLLDAVASEVASGELGSDDLVLLLDADHTVEFDGDWLADIDGMGGDSYLLSVGPEPVYRMTYLVRAGRAWRYHGATHEYLNAEPAPHRLITDAVRIVHHGDGGTRHEKLPRDLALLEAEVARNPNDARTCFYLAQTLKDLGRIDDATSAYLRRADIGGWDEEAYVSLLWAGRLQVDHDLSAAVDAWIRAHELRPGRAECLFELSRHLRTHGRHHSSWLFAQRGSQLPPSGDLLFVERWLEDWGMVLEAAVAAWWAGHASVGLSLCDRLLEGANLPESDRPGVRDVRAWCVESVGPE